MTEVSGDPAADQMKRLQGCITDLLSVLALPAIWSGQGPSEIGDTLLDVLVGMLRLDFVYLGLNDAIDGSPVEWLRTGQQQSRVAQPGAVGRMLHSWLADPLSTPAVLPNPVGEGEVTVAAFRLGLQEEVGGLVAGSRRADFPTDIEKLLLRVASNQAAMALAEARLSAELRRAAAELEQRVNERTSQLAATNEELTKEVGERKRADDALRRSRAYLLAGQELSHTGSYSRLITGEAYWSEETYRIFGLDPAGPPPTAERVLELFHPDDRHLAIEAWNALGAGIRNIEQDYRIIRPDGEVRYLHATSQSVLDEAGKVSEYIGVIMDVTDRKRTERALRRARERALEAHFTAVLEERTRLARDIHDTLLQGFTGISLKLVAATGRVTEPPESVAALRDLIDLAQQTLIDARRAVWDLRALSLEGADLPVALRNAAQDCVRGTELRLEYDVRGSARGVGQAVEEVMVRVLREAITNAVKHAGARTVRVRLSFNNRGVRLSVDDDGCGFVLDPDLRSYGGHWGLLGMRERATQIHGKLSLRSAPGHGTRLVLLVPYAVVATTPPARVAQPASRRSG